MRYEIVLSPEANEDLKHLGAHDRAKVKELMEVHLRYEPSKISKSRIKRLRGFLRPQYRLRIDDFRIFYDVDGTKVEVLAIISKTEAVRWLARLGRGR